MYFILEHSFHTNEKATRWLLQEENLRRLAVTEADILQSFYGISLPGDVNGDGLVKATDYMTIKNHIMDVKKIVQ